MKLLLFLVLAALVVTDKLAKSVAEAVDPVASKIEDMNKISRVEFINEK